MIEQPLLSVVVPTLNRPQAIVDLVHDFQTQDYPRFEMIVVDASTAENIQLADIAKNDSRLRVIRITTGGTCVARNTGVRAAQGAIIVFTDDDVRLADNKFLLAHSSHYDDENIAGVGGRVLDVNQELNREQTGPVCRVTKTGRIYPNATSTVSQDINAPRGGNMSFRKQIIVDVGMFDEQFRGNAMREETDFSLRVVEAGWRIVFEPRASLTHLALAGGSRTADRLTWYRDFFFNENYFFLKHFPNRYLPMLLVRKARAMAACWLYYGHGKISWLLAPWQSFAQAKKLVHTSRA